MERGNLKHNVIFREIMTIYNRQNLKMHREIFCSFFNTGHLKLTLGRLNICIFSRAYLKKKIL